MSYKSPYAGEENNIAKPNRTPEEIAAWTQQMAADLLTFSPPDYKTRIAGFKKNFVAAGWQPYAEFLKGSQIIDRVKDGGYSVSTIVSGAPEITNQGENEGVYHWIVKLPITISYFAPGAGKTRAETTGSYTLFMDTARVAPSGGEGGSESANNALAIQNWRIDATPQ